MAGVGSCLVSMVNVKGGSDEHNTPPSVPLTDEDDTSEFSLASGRHWSVASVSRWKSVVPLLYGAEGC